MSFPFQVRLSVEAFYYYGQPMSKSKKVFNGQADLSPGEGMMIWSLLVSSNLYYMRRCSSIRKDKFSLIQYPHMCIGMGVHGSPSPEGAGIGHNMASVTK